MEIVTNFIFLGSKITADGDWGHEIKRCLLLGRKSMTNLDSILKNRDIILLTDVHVVKTMCVCVCVCVCFPSSHVWMWELDHKANWAPKNWCLLTVVLEKTPENPLDNKIKPVNPNRISPEYSLEGLMLKLKCNTLATWCKELTHWKRLCCWARLNAGGERDNWGWDGWMASLTRWAWVWVNSGSWWWTGRPGMLESMGHRVRQDWATELNWESNYLGYMFQKEWS